MVRRWVSAYRHHGEAGLVRQRGAYTHEFKLEVLSRHVAENLSCQELAAIIISATVQHHNVTTAAIAGRASFAKAYGPVRAACFDVSKEKNLESIVTSRAV
jgi:hypothetical protein